jgi:hypothetical protein
MMQFENYNIRLLENNDVEAYFLMVEKNKKDWKIFLQVQFLKQKPLRILKYL